MFVFNRSFAAACAALVIAGAGAAWQLATDVAGAGLPEALATANASESEGAPAPDVPSATRTAQAREPVHCRRQPL